MNIQQSKYDVNDKVRFIANIDTGETWVERELEGGIINVEVKCNKSVYSGEYTEIEYDIFVPGINHHGDALSEEGKGTVFTRQAEDSIIELLDKCNFVGGE